MEIKPKNILITGVSRGIGLEMTKLLLDRGYNVLGVSRNITPLATLQQKFSNLSVISVDISDEEQLKLIVKFVETTWKKVDIIIHNAGRLINKPFEQTTTKDFLDVYKVNVFAVAELTRVLLPFLSSGSHIVTISSMGGIQGSLKFAGLSAYSSSKGAVITLVELLAEEYKDKNIAFNALAIGAVQTEMLFEAFPDYKAPISAEEMAVYICDFALSGNKYYNGKVLQVSSSTP